MTKKAIAKFSHFLNEMWILDIAEATFIPLYVK